MTQITTTNRHKIVALEEALFAAPEIHVELEPKHHFAHGTYTRELFIPAGTLVTGKIHRYECTNILLKGKVLAITDEGQFELEAPHVMTCGPDVKKAVLALEDTIWLNIHPWNGEDTLEQIEEKVIIKPELALEHEEIPCLGE